MKKPCRGCIIFVNCSAVCDDFLQWIVDQRKSNLRTHPHFEIATIHTDQINWLNEKLKLQKRDSIGFLFPD